MPTSDYVDRLLTQVFDLIGRLPLIVRIPLAILAVLVCAALFLVLFIPWIIWGLIQGVWFRFFPPQATRDLSRLGGDGADLDLTVETIADEGQPLKEHHRRRILRDKRLLPKPKLPPNVWPRPRRKKVMSADEANRLFAGTLRTRNRRLGDLLADAEQLRRYGLPVWKTEAELAAALEISVKKLRHYSIHRQAERVCHYVTFAIPKRNGQKRLIMAPKRELKALQRRLLTLLVDKLPLSPHAHGFRAGRSIRTGALPHVGRAIVLKMDLRDFFPSVTFARVRGLLIALGYGYTVATTLAVLMTEAERQPVEIDGAIVYVPVGQRYCVQGAPTSPGLCNALCLRLDRRLAGLAQKFGWTYTRYADDLTFSGDSREHEKSVFNLAGRICQEEGFAINPEKTRRLRRGRRQTVTGVVVNDRPGLSRQERRRLRAVIHRLGTPALRDTASMSPARLRGKLAYLHMLNPQQAAALLKKGTGDVLH